MISTEEFLEACRAGDADKAAAALDAGMDANASVPYADGETKTQLSALYYACVGNHTKVASLLLARGANPNDGESVYHAAELNHRDCLEVLVAHGADISGRSVSYENTPLYFLSGYQAGSKSAPTAMLGMKWLLEHGADPNVWSEENRETPLHRVAQHGRLDLVELLLAHGADAGLARADGRTPYVLAVRGGHEGVATLLRSRGTGVGGVTPVDELIGACARGDEAGAVARLAAHPGLPASFTADDRASAVQAVYDDRESAVRAMRAVGFDLGWEGLWGGTPLHHAAWLGKAPMTRLLISLGAPVNARDSRFGSSPMGWAAHGSRNCRSADDEYCAIVGALLDAGATREASFNKWGEPPEQLSTKRVGAFLKERGFAP